MLQATKNLMREKVISSFSVDESLSVKLAMDLYAGGLALEPTESGESGGLEPCEIY